MDADLKTVVIAEDEVLTRMLAADRFADAGYNVIEAKHSAHALTALRSQVVHLLFTDIHMPGAMNGLALAKLVRLEWPLIHVIIASGDYRPAADDLPEGGSFFRKPYHIDLVVDEAQMLMG